MIRVINRCIVLLMLVVFFVLSVMGYFRFDSQIHAQQLWTTHLYMTPTDNGLGIVAAVSSQDDICNKVTFTLIDVRYGKLPAPFDGSYDSDQLIYRGELSKDVFKKPDDDELGEINAQCNLKAGGTLKTLDIELYRYYVKVNLFRKIYTPPFPEKGHSLAVLTIDTNTLKENIRIITVSSPITPLVAPPPGVVLIPRFYTYRISTSHSPNNDTDLFNDDMMLTISYFNSEVPATLTKTLRIYALIPRENAEHTGSWVADDHQTVDPNPLDSSQPQVRMLTTRFTTFALGYKKQTVYLPMLIK